MILAHYKKHFLRICQVWYPESFVQWNAKKKNSDFVYFHGIQEENDEFAHFEKRGIVSRFHSLYTVLTNPEETLLSKIHKTDRYDIRRSERDEITIEIADAKRLREDPRFVKGLSQMYEEMYRQKDLPQTFNLAVFQAYIEADAATITAVYQNGIPLVFHSYVCGEHTVRLLHSVSEFRDGNADATVIGRANKRLHWEDIRFFQQQGKQRYDWGGISNPEEPNGIDKFKMRFGGEAVTYENIIVGTSLLGRIGIVAMKLLGKA